MTSSLSAESTWTRNPCYILCKRNYRLCNKTTEQPISFAFQITLVIAIALTLKFKEMYSSSSYYYDNAETEGSALTDQKLEFFIGATISGLVLCFLIFFTFFFGLYNLFGAHTNSIALVRILCLSEIFPMA